ncbi:MAG: hypothetical protein JEZ12_04530 [Desulfobacterium sp.]|nr:hypothetical protein [Desulfobacterium sp.]
MDAYEDASQWRYLDRIVDKIADGWHVWQIEDPDLIEETNWIDGPGRKWLRELFQKAALASCYQTSSVYPRRQVLVSLFSHDPNTLKPEQAAKYVTKPLTILMENRFTDGEIFLNEVLKVLAPDEINEQRRLAPDSILYDSGGGIGELPKLVADYAVRADADGIPRRAVVLTDGDGELPGEVKANAQLVQQACQKEGIPCWTLSKRTIENYIPDEVLDAWMPYSDSGKGKRVAAIKRLNPEQRDHYPMKKGLKLQKAVPDVRAFYSGTSGADMDELSKGLGSDVIEKFREFSSVLSAESLRGRDGNGELDKLIEMIADLL